MEDNIDDSEVNTNLLLLLWMECEWNQENYAHNLFSKTGNLFHIYTFRTKISL